MGVIPTEEQPKFCKNCTHRFICNIQCNLTDFDTAVKDFNETNRSSLQSVSASYVCRYKSIDLNVED